MTTKKKEEQQATKTPHEMNIYEKLIAVRRAIPYLQKEKKGEKFDYVGSSTVLGAARKMMDDLNLYLQTEIVDKRVNVRERIDAKGKVSYQYEAELDLMMTWVNGDNPQEHIKIPWFAMGNDIGDNAKAVGKALTYGEKYFMLKQFNIPTDNDDPDAYQERAESYVHTKPDAEQLEQFFALVQEYAQTRGVPDAQVYQALNMKSAKDIQKATSVQVDTYINTLQQWLEGWKASKEKFKTFHALVDEFAHLRGKTAEQVYQALAIKDPNNVTPAQVDKYIKQLQAWIANAKRQAQPQQQAM